VITGSFNFTAAAKKSNAENLLIITGKHALAEAYEKNFGSTKGVTTHYGNKRNE